MARATVAGMITTLTDPADLQWLRDTHLKGLDAAVQPFVVAVLHGNEDCPQVIELYRENDYRCLPQRWVLVDQNGTFTYRIG